MGYCPITKYNLGVAKDFKDSKEYANEIFFIYSMSIEDYNSVSFNCLNLSKEYDYELLTKKYIDCCLV